MHDLKFGDAIKAKDGTLARFCGDDEGSVERIEGETIYCRMRNSGKIVPFRRDQIDHIAHAFKHGVHR